MQQICYFFKRFSALLHKKRWKWQFWLAFGVHSTQTLVKIYNSQCNSHSPEKPTKLILILNMKLLIFTTLVSKSCFNCAVIFEKIITGNLNDFLYVFLSHATCAKRGLVCTCPNAGHFICQPLHISAKS